MWEDGINQLVGLRIGASQLHVGIVVHDVATLCRQICGQMPTDIYVIGRLVGIGHHVHLILIRAVAYHYGWVFASDVGHGLSGATFGSGIVEVVCHRCGYGQMGCACPNIVYQRACHGYLGLRIFAKRHADGVADAVG